MTRIPRIALAAGLLLILAIYSMGWSGTLHFDDNPNLDGLYGVSDFTSGLQFVLSGESGPTGRPLSLATFALQHEAWPDPMPFLVVNTLLHVINGLLCFLLLRRLLGWMLPDARSAEWLAVTIALIWAASPFLASSTLVVVQRMTGLSAFFALLALNVYTMARTGYRPDSWRSNLWLASIAGAGTLLAGLAKENGFLLPLFLLLIEWLLVANARVTIRPLHKSFFWVILVVPVAVILVYLLYRGLLPSGYVYRDFTLTERLLTQPRVLFDYIYHLLIPVTQSVTPFRDAYEHSTGMLTPVTTLISSFGLTILLILAWIRRHRNPVIVFGIFLFFTGHLVESTTVPLELYFRHRNYIPAIGFYLALIVGFHHLFRRLRVAPWIPCGAAALYLLIVAGVLGLGTSLWGNRQVAAELWYMQKEKSIRAAIYLYDYYVDNDEMIVAASLIERFIKEHPGVAIFTIQALSICDAEERIYKNKLDRAISALKSKPVITGNLAGTIQQFSASAKDSGCPHFGLEQAEKLVDAALVGEEHKAIAPAAQQNLLFARAQLADHLGQYRVGIDALMKAMKIEPNLDAVLLIAYFYTELGERRSAIDYIEAILADPPAEFPRRLVWESRLNELLDTLR